MNRAIKFAVVLAVASVPAVANDFNPDEVFIPGELYQLTQERERGVHHYEYWRGAEPGLYYCLLSFDDYLTFLAHQTSDHHESASPRLGELVRNMKLEWVDPVAGASQLSTTEHQELPDGADELTARYHRGFAPQLQEWWATGRRAV